MLTVSSESALTLFIVTVVEFIYLIKTGIFSSLIIFGVILVLLLSYEVLK